MNDKPLNIKEIFNILQNLKINELISTTIEVIKSEERILANDIVSNINLPPFDNSAVDGFALHNDDIENENELKINHRILAGDNNQVKLSNGEVARIFTGAKMPINSSTVVMQENAFFNNDIIRIKKKPLIGENCRLKGEDIIRNKKIFNAGEKITNTNISLLAAIGKHTIKIKERLKIGYFTSGNELLNPTEKLKGSQINNSNKYTLHSLLNKKYIEAKYLGVLEDSKKVIVDSFLKNIHQHSVIITTGGASVGDEDYLIESIKENGELFFWKASIKPGRPLAVGKIDKTIIICLPGNPVSVYLLFGMIIRPFLEFLCGAVMKLPKSYMAKVNFSMKKKTGRLEWLRVNIDRNKETGIWLNKFSRQGSGIISSISFSEGIVEIPEDVKEINFGDQFNYYSFNDMFN